MLSALASLARRGIIAHAQAPAAIARQHLTVPSSLRPAFHMAQRALSTRGDGDPLAAFMDPYDTDPDLQPPGRAWKASELRLKSNEDLERLWVVLQRERNMLITSRYHHKVMKTEMKYPERYHAVRKSMARLKLVVRERDIFDAERAARRKLRARETFLHVPPRPPAPPSLLDDNAEVHKGVVGDAAMMQ